MVSGDECVFCPGGTVGPTNQGTGKAIRGWRSDQPYVCIPCDAGKFRGLTEQIEECVECPVGLYAVAGSSECSECSAGRVPNANDVGASGCVSCSTGQGPNSNATACIRCASGRYSMTGVCQSCGHPNVVDSASTSCTPCVAGQGPNSDRTDCNSCTGSQFSTLGVCVECAEPNIVVDSFRTCRACSAGEAPNDNRTACISCTIGRYSSFGVECQVCAEPRVVQQSASQCNACPAGAGPNDNRTGCLACHGNTYSELGCTCKTCPRGTSANADRTQCNDIEQGQALTDPAVLDAILTGTEFLRPTARLELDVSDAVLDDGSVAQNEFFQQVAADLATALGVEVADINVIGIQHANRRILQSTSAAQLKFEIAPAAAANVMTALNSQMADASSPLRTSGGSLAIINLDVAPVFNIICPVGKHLPAGAADCERCPAGEFLNSETDPSKPSCKACVAALGEEPSDLGDRCVCMSGFYNTITRAAITCHRGDYFPPPTALPLCTACDELDCVTNCSGGGHVVTVEQGWSAIVQSDGTVSVLECATDSVDKSSSGGCPGGKTNATVVNTACAGGYNGLLCGSCDAGYTRGSGGLCTKCEDWSVAGGILILVLVILTLFALMHVSAWYGSLTAVQAVVESIKEMEVTAIGKMLLATVQIITALPNVLGIQLPGIFRSFLNMLSVFRFDPMLSPGIGKCVRVGNRYHRAHLHADCLSHPSFANFVVDYL